MVFKWYLCSVKMVNQQEKHHKTTIRAPQTPKSYPAPYRPCAPQHIQRKTGCKKTHYSINPLSLSLSMDDNNLQPNDAGQDVITAAEADRAAAEAINRAIAESSGTDRDAGIDKDGINAESDKSDDSLTMSRAELLDVVRRACRDAIAEVRKTDAAPSAAAADDSKPRNTAVDESTPTFLSNIRPGFWDRM